MNNASGLAAPASVSRLPTQIQNSGPACGAAGSSCANRPRSHQNDGDWQTAARNTAGWRVAASAAARPLRLTPGDHDLGHAGVFLADGVDEVACEEPRVFRAADEVLVASGGATIGKEDSHGRRDRPPLLQPPHDGRRPDPLQVELGVQKQDRCCRPTGRRDQRPNGPLEHPRPTPQRPLREVRVRHDARRPLSGSRRRIRRRWGCPL
jgi:hypothetical protein